MPQFAGGFAGVFADPSAEISGFTEPAFFRDAGDFVGSVTQERFGFLKADASQIFDDRDAGLLVEEPAERSAVIAEFGGDAFGGKVGIGEFLLDDLPAR